MDVPPKVTAPQTPLSIDEIAEVEVAAMPEETASLSAEPAGLPLGKLANRTFWYSLANLGYGMFFALNNATLTLLLKNMGASGVLIGLMGSSHSLEGAVIQPFVGAASDRLRTPFGRRRPFILAFTPLSALFLLLTPAASNLPIGIRLTAVVTCIFLFTIFFNVAQDPYLSLMPDIIPPRQRGRVTAIWTFFGVTGQATLVLLNIPLILKFSLVAIVMLVTTLLTCVGVREPLHPPQSVKLGCMAELKAALAGLNTLRQARKSLTALFFLGMGVGAVLPFLTVFVSKITGCSDHDAERMFLVLMISTAVSVLPFGWLCDRIGPKSVLLIALILISLAAINGLWVQTLPQVAGVLVLAGMGNAAQSASAYPLLTRLVPADEVGFYTGLQSTALSIAAPVTAVVTGLLVDHGGYRLIFAVCGVSVGIALTILARLHMAQAVQEIRVRQTEM